MSGVKRTERGWAGHFICSGRCRFRRNTLLELGDTKIVISSVGLLLSMDESKFETVGHDRYFETMVFRANKTDTRYFDTDVSKQIFFDSPWSISEIDADDKANVMHDKVVEEITHNLLHGVTMKGTSE